MTLASVQTHEFWSTQDIVGFCATITTVLVFLSGTEVCFKIFTQKSTHNVSYAPFLSGVVNCFLWLEYGMHANDHTLMLVNFIGVVLQFGYSVMYYIYTSNKMGCVKSFIAVSVLLSLLHIFTSFMDPESAKFFSGLFACTAVIVFIASPLVDIVNVVKTKNTESLPFIMIFLTFCMAILWVMYGLLAQDNFVIIPNSIGTLISTFELLLYCIYSKKHSHAPVYKPNGNSI